MNQTDYDIGKEMSMKKERKPNIIYVMADQLRYQSCGYAGDEKAHTPNIDEFAFLQNTGACAKWENGHDWRGIRDKRYTYAIYRLDKKELLFDNIKDPYQMNNLAQDERYIDKIKEYREKLDKKMKSINDTFEESTWYRDQWIKDRCIVKTATMN